ncbi:hypothetical protein [Spiroplasma endosymbiont of Aspidapion aeneum]|uniref:hypothetical protein n=1 Tax=Spiroplasma endosymbiont of Aspidapion aeneum TaxID=3066276 RepID=UPI00313E4DA8
MKKLLFCLTSIINFFTFHFSFLLQSQITNTFKNKQQTYQLKADNISNNNDTENKELSGMWVGKALQYYLLKNSNIEKNLTALKIEKNLETSHILDSTNKDYFYMSLISSIVVVSTQAMSSYQDFFAQSYSKWVSAPKASRNKSWELLNDFFLNTYPKLIKLKIGGISKYNLNTKDILPSTIKDLINKQAKQSILSYDTSLKKVKDNSLTLTGLGYGDFTYTPNDKTKQSTISPKGFGYSNNIGYLGENIPDFYNKNTYYTNFGIYNAIKMAKTWGNIIINVENGEDDIIQFLKTTNCYDTDKYTAQENKGYYPNKKLFDEISEWMNDSYTISSTASSSQYNSLLNDLKKSQYNSLQKIDKSFASCTLDNGVNKTNKSQSSDIFLFATLNAIKNNNNLDQEHTQKLSDDLINIFNISKYICGDYFCNYLDAFIISPDSPLKALGQTKTSYTKTSFESTSTTKGGYVIISIDALTMWNDPNSNSDFELENANSSQDIFSSVSLQFGNILDGYGAADFGNLQLLQNNFIKNNGLNSKTPFYDGQIYGVGSYWDNGENSNPKPESNVSFGEILFYTLFSFLVLFIIISTYLFIKRKKKKNRGK